MVSWIQKFRQYPLVVWLIENTFHMRFKLARLTRLPVLGRIVNYLLFEKDSIVYVPQTKVVQLNTSIDTENDDGGIVLPQQVVEHFVMKATHLWRMDFCICRKSETCSNYPIDLGCLFLGEATQQIDSRLGKPVGREEALVHLQKCREAGLVHLIGRNKLDSVWLNARPSNKLLTICNCCPCCCLWKMLPDLPNQISDKVTALPGVQVRVTETCTGCGVCTNGVCFVKAIQLINGKASISDACRGCGRCVDVCPEQAIHIYLDTSALQSSIAHIDSIIDIQ